MDITLSKDGDDTLSDGDEASADVLPKLRRNAAIVTMTRFVIILPVAIGFFLLASCSCVTGRNPPTIGHSITSLH